MRKTSIISLILLLVTIFIGCNDDDSFNKPYLTDGEIQFTVDVNHNHTKFSLTDSYSNFSSYDQSIIYNYSSNASAITISRYSADFGNKITLQLLIDSVGNYKSAYLLNGVFLDMSIINPDNSMYRLYVLPNQFNPEPYLPTSNKIRTYEFKNVKFDKTSKKISGEFLYSYKDDSEINNETVRLSGNFNVQLYQRVN